MFIWKIKIVTFQKYLPFLLHQQTATEYLTGQKHRLPETFIDTDGYVEKNLSGKHILIDKLHNLYYFPFDLSRLKHNGMKIEQFLTDHRRKVCQIFHFCVWNDTRIVENSTQAPWTIQNNW